MITDNDLSSFVNQEVVVYYTRREGNVKIVGIYILCFMTGFDKTHIFTESGNLPRESIVEMKSREKLLEEEGEERDFVLMMELPYTYASKGETQQRATGRMNAVARKNQPGVEFVSVNLKKPKREGS